METAKICTNCGYTCSSINFASGSSNDAGSTYANSVSLNQKYNTKVDSHGPTVRTVGVIKLMNTFLEKYANSRHLKEAAENMLTKTLKELETRARRHNTYGAATVLIVLRESNEAVFLPEVATYFGVTAGEAAQKVRQIMISSRKSHPMTPIECFVDKYLGDITGMKDKAKIKRLALTLIDLFQKLNLSATPKTISLLALYYAMITMENKVPPLTVPKFFKRTALGKSNSAFERSSCIAKRKLIILAKRLPWASNVTVKNYHTFMNDILKHHSILFVKTADSYSASIAGVSDYNVKRSTEVAIDASTVTEQMQLELPACTIRSMLRPAPAVEDGPDPEFVSSSEVLGENDCPEAELKEYLRTSDEVKTYLKIQNLATDSTD